ncbi:hypothetical protein [Nonomuraea sp. SBT364]|uniref:hypothetical protein n=1 Tax=Nonomuraea sp. SBT364 TaxID=1580530 RepID=UPI0018CF2371|nr:hypothetical protein [Nonomuraea sp. SBT364]
MDSLAAHQNCDHGESSFIHVDNFIRLDNLMASSRSMICSATEVMRSCASENAPGPVAALQLDYIATRDNMNTATNAPLAGGSLAAEQASPAAPALSPPSSTRSASQRPPPAVVALAGRGVESFEGGLADVLALGSRPSR